MLPKSREAKAITHASESFEQEEREAKAITLREQSSSS
jgi:hypothetical protein